MKFVCQDCGKACKTTAALKGHFRLTHTVKGQEQSAKARIKANAADRTPRWNKGLSAESDERIRAQAAQVSKLFKGRKGRPWTVAEKQKLSLYARQNKYGGYRPGSGRGKKGWYQDYWCDSSWELAWVIYHLEHNTKFVRNLNKFSYEYNAVRHNYIPDFYVPENKQYVEVKGYCTDLELLKVKTAALNSPVLVFDKVLMAPILMYVEQKYGKGFIRLYEK